MAKTSVKNSEEEAKIIPEQPEESLNVSPISPMADEPPVIDEPPAVAAPEIETTQESEETPQVSDAPVDPETPEEVIVDSSLENEETVAAETDSGVLATPEDEAVASSPSEAVVGAIETKKGLLQTIKKKPLFAVAVGVVLIGVALGFVMGGGSKDKTGTLGAKIVAPPATDPNTTARAYIAAFINGDKKTVDTMQSKDQLAQMAKVNVTSFYDYCKGFKEACYDIHMVFRDIPETGVKLTDYVTREGAKGQTVTIAVPHKKGEEPGVAYIALGIIQEDGKWVIDSEDYDILATSQLKQ